ncbi:hypothetical protein V5O48_007838 [Marasmius crinis-equi]|uniref:Uncharacterized protein n=1 Tax=Marasmius crinis-equi TaxID=585013 RepID=A0ABR3FFG9_9AGAR
MPLPLIPLNLADIVINTFLYGIFFILDTVSIALIWNSPVRRRQSWRRVLRKPMFLGAIGLFVTITAHWITNVMRLFHAFERGTVPLEYYSDMSQDIYAVKTGLVMASIVSGDIMMIYRLWVVWNCRYLVIILPSLSVIGLAATGSGITWDLAHYKKGMDIFSGRAQVWVISEAVFTVLTNVYTTALIAWRIWQTNRRSLPHKPGPSPGSLHLTAAIIILVESAVLNTSFLITFIVTYIIHHRIEGLIVDCLPPIAGISFGLINIRCHLSRVRTASDQVLSATPGSPEIPRFGNVVEGEGGGMGSDDVDVLAYPMQPLAIHIVADTRSPEESTESQIDRPKVTGVPPTHLGCV